jgi:prolyl-tRNA editing enzyme YbaK/EbsC (Cys-tRNA(Pro) deacylase)
MQEVASATHIPGKELAKTVIVEIDGRLAMAVLPASQKVELEQLRESLGAQRVTLAREDVFRGRFPECEPGAMPPFGNLYDMDVYVADSLAEDEEIAFNAGSHTQLVILPGLRAVGAARPCVRGTPDGAPLTVVKGSLEGPGTEPRRRRAVRRRAACARPHSSCWSMTGTLRWSRRAPRLIEVVTDRDIAAVRRPGRRAGARFA